jgi:putative ABC transport system ATP-binding protein
MGVTVSAEHVVFAYRSRQGDVPVLRDLDLQLEPGAYLSLMGASGAGKSTLLGLLGGLIPPQSGTLRVGEHALAAMRSAELAEYRREVVGFIFQHYGLVDVLSALENVELALALSGVSRARRAGRARDVLAAVDLSHRAAHRPPKLSGGERQRVAIARALANDPKLILADEPTGNLDEAASQSILGLMERVHDDRGCTIVVVTHNSSVAARAGRRYVLRDGMLVQAA